jgi:CHAT domain
MVSNAVHPGLFGPDMPQLTKFAIHLLRDGHDTLDVTLTIPLDSTKPAEQAAIEQFAPTDATLDVRYVVQMNLAAEREELSRRFSDTYRKHPIRQQLKSPEMVPLSLDQVQEAFGPIAIQGNSIYHRLFEPRMKPGLLLNYGDDEAPMIWAAVRSALARPHRLAVKSPLSLFPWNFLYDDCTIEENDLSSFDPRRFWGFRHVIQEEITGTAMAVRLPPSPHIIAAVCPAVDSTGKHRNGPLGQRAGVDWLRSTEQLKGALANFNADCLYFYGHAVQNDPPTPTTSSLKLDGMQLTAFAIHKVEGPRFNKRPVFVFLNGCETQPLNVWDSGSIAGLFCLESGARVCCVTTFAEVPISFGAAFAHAFWEGFLKGENAGAALLSARNKMLNEYNNPVGLLYNLFGRVETRLG